MKKSISYFAIFSVLLMSCNSKPSLEKYFVENTENKNFVQVDVSPSILNIEKNKLSISNYTLSVTPNISLNQVVDKYLKKKPWIIILIIRVL